MDNNKAYTSAEHRWRWAAWAASTAASASPKCRFKVRTGAIILESADLRKLAQGWEMLPRAEGFDSWHDAQCDKIREHGQNAIGNRFNYGVAAKLLNCYLKSLFISGCNSELSAENLAKQSSIHPPIDRLLMTAMAKEIKDMKAFWNGYQKKGWSNFHREDYQEVIEGIKRLAGAEPLWTIEQYWPGFQ